MASYCPKCSYKLSLVDIKPDCPVCGVNLVYYGMEDSLKKVADTAEFEHACLQPRLDRLKAATIGSPLAIVRIIAVFLPVLAMLIPMGKTVVTLPFSEKVTSINLVSIITEAIMNINFDQVMALAGSNTVGTAYIFYLIALVCAVLIVVLMIVNIVDLFISCSKKGVIRNIVVSSIGLAITLLGTVSLFLWSSQLTAAMPEIFTGTVSVLGPIAVCVGFIVQIVINAIFKKKGTKVKYKDVSEFLLPYDEREKLREEAKKA